MSLLILQYITVRFSVGMILFALWQCFASSDFNLLLCDSNKEEYPLIACLANALKVFLIILVSSQLSNSNLLCCFTAAGRISCFQPSSLKTVIKERVEYQMVHVVFLFEQIDLYTLILNFIHWMVLILMSCKRLALRCGGNQPSIRKSLKMLTWHGKKVKII